MIRLRYTRAIVTRGSLLVILSAIATTRCGRLSFNEEVAPAFDARLDASLANCAIRSVGLPCQPWGVAYGNASTTLEGDRLRITPLNTGLNDGGCRGTLAVPFSLPGVTVQIPAVLPAGSTAGI